MESGMDGSCKDAGLGKRQVAVISLMFRMERRIIPEL